MKEKIRKYIKKNLTPKQPEIIKKIKRVLLNVKKNQIFYSKRIRDKKRELFFKYFYRGERPNVKIILTDFSGYPLYRKKPICKSLIDCGIGNFFDNAMKYIAGVDFEVILIITSEDSESKEILNRYESLLPKYPFIKKLFLVDNRFFDFGAYNRGYQYLRSTDYRGDVVFMNSSVRGPYNNYWLLKYSYLFHSNKNIGLCGISLNSHTTHLQTYVFKPHVQSFFMYTSMVVLTSVFGASLFEEVDVPISKIDVISKCEIGFSQKILEHGYGICSALFENFVYYKGNKWRVPKWDLRYNPLYNQFANIL